MPNVACNAMSRVAAADVMGWFFDSHCLVTSSLFAEILAV